MKNDCMYLEVDQDTDDYGRYIAPPVYYCTKGYPGCNLDCPDYKKWGDVK